MSAGAVWCIDRLGLAQSYSFRRPTPTKYAGCQPSLGLPPLIHRAGTLRSPRREPGREKQLPSFNGFWVMGNRGDTLVHSEREPVLFLDQLRGVIRSNVGKLTERFAEAFDDHTLDACHGHLASQFALEARHPVLADAAGCDPVEPGEVGLDVEREAVGGDPT